MHDPENGGVSSARGRNFRVVVPYGRSTTSRADL